MRSLRFGMVAVCALAAFGAVAIAQDRKAPKIQACNAIPTQATCEGRQDCQWIAALIDAKTSKQMRKAYCRAKPTVVPPKPTPAIKPAPKK